MEISVGVRCSLDLTLYPFDRHECKVKFSSSSFPLEVVRYYTSGLSKSRLGIEHPLKYHVGYTEMTQEKDFLFVGTHSNWSTCGFYVKLDRKLSPAIINFLVPSMLIVIISFCGHVKSCQGRRRLGCAMLSPGYIWSRLPDSKSWSLPFLGLRPRPSTLAQSKERQGSNFAV